MKGRRSMVRIFFALSALLVASSAPAQVAELVKDLAIGRDQEGVSLDTAAVFETEVLGRTAFLRTDYSRVWQSDGTVAGTEPVAEGFFIGTTETSAYFSVEFSEPNDRQIWRLDAFSGRLERSNLQVPALGRGVTAGGRLVFPSAVVSNDGRPSFAALDRNDFTIFRFFPPGTRDLGRLFGGETVLYAELALDGGGNALFALTSFNGPFERVYDYKGSPSDVEVEVVGDRALIFDSHSGLTLSTTLGTLASTELLTDFDSSFASQLTDGLAISTSEAGTIFQVASNARWEAWSTDGTRGGTRRLASDDSSGRRSALAHPTGFVTFHEGFLRRFDARGREAAPRIEASRLLGVFGDRAFYTASTSPAEFRARDLRTDADSLLSTQALPVGGPAIAVTTVGIVYRSGDGIWLSDGTGAGTRELLNQPRGFQSQVQPLQVVETSTHLFLNRYSSAYSWRKGSQRALPILEFLPRPLGTDFSSVAGSQRGTTAFVQNRGPSGTVRFDASNGTEVGTRTLGVPSNCSVDGSFWFVRGDELITTCNAQSLLARSAGNKRARLLDIQGELFFTRGPRTVDLERGTVVLAGDGGVRDCVLFVTNGTSAGTRCLRDVGLEQTTVSEPSRSGALVRFTLCQGFTPDCELLETDGETVTTLTAGLVGPAITPIVESGNRLHWIGNDFGEVRHVSVDLLGGSLRTKTLLQSASTLYDLAVADDRLVVAGAIDILPGGAQSGLFRLDPQGQADPTPLTPQGLWLGLDAGLTPLGNLLLVRSDEPWVTEGTAATTRRLAEIAPGEEGSAPSRFVVAGEHAYFTAFTRQLGRELWRTDGTSAGTRLVQDIQPGAGSSRPDSISATSDRLYFFADDGLHGRELHSLPLTDDACTASPFSHCLNKGRFHVAMTWRDFQGNEGRGLSLPVSDDTGGFWFFDSENVEAMTKVIDGTAVNGFYWAFSGSLSNVAYTITVTDSATGLAKRYYNPSGNFGSRGDTTALSDRSVPKPNETASATPVRLNVRHSRTTSQVACTTTTEALCLADRFLAEVRWRDFQGNEGAGKALAFTDDTGNFWFFDRENIELTVKALDGRGVNGNFWIFFGALSNVAYDLQITDTVTGAVRTYSNPLRRFASIGDTAAFPGQ